MRAPNPVLARYGTTVFEVMSRLAREANAINLGQGFPEDGVPEDVVDYAAAALKSESNQYPPMLGIPALRQAMAKHDERFYGLQVDWQRETMVTTGATEALSAVFLALLDAGDEAIVFEPAYDCYAPMIERSGATMQRIRLEPPAWTLPVEALERACNTRTKLIVLNTPMNPTGKVFTHAELETIANVAKKHDAYVLCDEVYEHIVFAPVEHVSLTTFPGMRERCVRVSSAGKTFSLTGWKVGGIVTSAALLERIARAHQYLVFTTPPNLQHAVAYGLNKPDDSFRALGQFMGAKRERFLRGLAKTGLQASACDGTYFVTANIAALGYSDDVTFCERLIADHGVAAIPLSAFYGASPRRDQVRFCFAKKDAVLDAALVRLQALKSKDA